MGERGGRGRGNLLVLDHGLLLLLRGLQRILPPSASHAMETGREGRMARAGGRGEEGGRLKGGRREREKEGETGRRQAERDGWKGVGTGAAAAEQQVALPVAASPSTADC